jgi:hypothetical protein
MFHVLRLARYPTADEIVRKKKRGAGFGPYDHDKIRLCPNKCPEARGSVGIYLMLRSL